MKKIVWIASYPKSGNTWLRAIISHLIYTNKGEFNFELLKLISQFDKNENYSFLENENKTDYKKIKKEINIIAKYWIKSQEKIVFSKKINPYYNIFKTHSANLVLNDYSFTNTNITLGCIYVVRDPREVLISYSKHSGKSIDNIINFMTNTHACFPPTNKNTFTLISRWDVHIKSWLGINVPYLLIKYEDLLNNTENEIIKINKFLNDILKIKIENFDIKLNNILKNISFENLKKYEKQHGFDEATKHTTFFRSGKKNTWKQILSSDQISKIETSFSETMKKLKYK